MCGSPTTGSSSRYTADDDGEGMVGGRVGGAFWRRSAFRDGDHRKFRRGASRTPRNFEAGERECEGKRPRQRCTDVLSASGAGAAPGGGANLTRDDRAEAGAIGNVRNRRHAGRAV